MFGNIFSITNCIFNNNDDLYNRWLKILQTHIKKYIHDSLIVPYDYNA